MCALCDNEHHEGMRGVVGGGRVWGVLDRGREKSKVARDWESLVPFHSYPDLPLAPNTSTGHKATRAVEKRGRYRTQALADTERHGEL